ncbi:MAG: radical SAM protein [Clostridia bacterium]|nr:radical SAM protein [Clostridia bacterium]
MIGSIAKEKISAKSRLITAWFEELALPVAPACNMMCNFCSRDSDCICNANNPSVLSRVMTPRQAVNWAVSCANKNKSIKVIKISGPGEPLFNKQTFEVLKRLNVHLPNHIFSISTNGLLLKERIDDLLRLNVGMVEVSLNSIYPESSYKLYSRLIKDERIINDKAKIADTLRESQIEGIKLCIKNGIEVKINTIFFPDINRDDIFNISELCRELGVKSMRLIPALPNGKLKAVHTPSLTEMTMLCELFSKKVSIVEIKTFTN